MIADEIIRERAPMESAAIAGIVASLLGIVSAVLFRYVDPTMSDQDLVRWYTDDGNQWRVILSLNLTAVSSIAFLWFVAVIRRRIGKREDKFFATVFLGSAIVWILVLLAGAVSLSAVPIAHGYAENWTPTPDVVRLSIGLGVGWLLVVGPRVQAVFILSASTLFIRTRAFPTWLGYFGYLMGFVLFFVPIVSRPVAFGFPIWILVASITILIVRRTLDLDHELVDSDHQQTNSDER